MGVLIRKSSEKKTRTSENNVETGSNLNIDACEPRNCIKILFS